MDRTSIAYKNFLKANALCKAIAKACGLKYIRQFSAQGVHVTRTKFWGVSHNITKTEKALKKLPFVQEVRVEGRETHNKGNHSYYYSLPSIRVIYDNSFLKVGKGILPLDWLQALKDEQELERLNIQINVDDLMQEFKVLKSRFKPYGYTLQVWRN